MPTGIQWLLALHVLSAFWLAAGSNRHRAKTWHKLRRW